MLIGREEGEGRKKFGEALGGSSLIVGFSVGNERKMKGCLVAEHGR